MKQAFTCPVCGYDDLHEPARRASGSSSYEICPSCWFEFGVTDEDEGWSDEDWRAQWIAQGMPWRSSVDPVPDCWQPQRQLDALLRGNG